MTDLENRTQAKLLKYSLLKYINRKDFDPTAELTVVQLATFFKIPTFCFWLFFIDKPSIRKGWITLTPRSIHQKQRRI